MSEEPIDESFFDFTCPYCGGLNSFPTSASHTLQECALCVESIIVPDVGAETGGKLPMPILAPRLLLRRFSPEDSAHLLKLLAEDDTFDLPITETDADQWIEVQRVARFTQTESGLFLAVELAERQEFAGYVSVHYESRERQCGRYYIWIAAARRRQGFGLECARAAMDFCFDGLCVRRIAVSCVSRDEAACRMVEKTGMRKEGESVKSWRDGADWVNLSSYAMLKEERK